MTAYRYAIFFAPRRDSAFWQWGSAWLGRDAFTGEAVAQPLIAGMEPDRLFQVTSEPRKYGFHGTLKPPFRLAPATTRGMLRGAVAAFAARQQPFRLGGMKVARIGRFLALVPVPRSRAMNALAADAMRAFEPFRGPPTEPELTRRRRAGLTPRQESLLCEWGYPYVMDEFRFHMSLTGPLHPDETAPLEAAIGDRFGETLRRPVAVDCLWLFEQTRAGAQFRAVEQHVLGASASERPDGAPTRAGAATASRAR
jgi:putative phosphonate metabolism protein